MNGKALITRVTDVPTDQMLRYSFEVAFLTANGYVDTKIIDTTFLPSDTVANIKTKIRQSVIDEGALLGLTITTTNVGSIMQI
jgi:hypothetical protein